MGAAATLRSRSTAGTTPRSRSSTTTAAGTSPTGRRARSACGTAPGSAGSDSSTLTVDEGAAGSDTFSLSGTGVANRFIFTTPPGSSALRRHRHRRHQRVEADHDHEQHGLSRQPERPPRRLGPGRVQRVRHCGSNVANECTANVSFQPTSQGGKSATLQIDGDSFQFTGTGIGQFDVSPLSLSFGTQRVNTASAAQPITFTNHRNNAVNVSVSNGNPADYNVDASDCAGSVAAGASCSVAVVFQPNATGPQSGTVTVQGQDVSARRDGHAPRSVGEPGLHRVRQPAGLHVVRHPHDHRHEHRNREPRHLAADARRYESRAIHDQRHLRRGVTAPAR